MSPFVIVMGLAWLGAEMAILGVVRWGARCAAEVSEGRPAPPFAVDAFARRVGAVFLAVAGFMFCANSIGDALFRTQFGFEMFFHLVWNAMCAAWVGLEGAIALYVLEIDGVLHGRARAGRGRLWLAIAWPAFAILYNALACVSAARQGFDDVQLARVLQFFLRFCGIGWIAFELVVARSGLRLGRLLAGAK